MTIKIITKKSSSRRGFIVKRPTSLFKNLTSRQKIGIIPAGFLTIFSPPRGQRRKRMKRMKTEELNLLTEECKKDREVKVKARGSSPFPSFCFSSPPSWSSRGAGKESGGPVIGLLHNGNDGRKSSRFMDEPQNPNWVMEYRSDGTFVSPKDFGGAGGMKSAATS